MNINLITIKPQIEMEHQGAVRGEDVLYNAAIGYDDANTFYQGTSFYSGGKVANIEVSVVKPEIELSST